MYSSKSRASLWIFYFIFTPLTVYPVYFILNLFLEVSLLGNTLILNNCTFPIEIINACVAGAAYYLLFILNISIPRIKTDKRIKMILFAFISLLIINVLRIVSLSLIFISKPEIFDISHKITWYFGSTLFVVVIWFIEVKKFRIKEIPFYSDVKILYKLIK